MILSLLSPSFWTSDGDAAQSVRIERRDGPNPHCALSYAIRQEVGSKSSRHTCARLMRW
jgi:hypothetical protein